MTDEELTIQLEELKKEKPEFYEFILDFANDLVSIQEVEKFLELSSSERDQFIKEYQSRREG